MTPRPQSRRHGPVRLDAIVVITTTEHWSQSAWRGAASRETLRARLPEAPLPRGMSIETPPGRIVAARTSATAHGSWSEPTATPLRPQARVEVGTISLQMSGSDVDLALVELPRAVPRRDERWLGGLQPGHAFEVSVNYRKPERLSGGPMIYSDTVTVAIWPTEAVDGLPITQVLDGLRHHRIDLREILF